MISGATGAMAVVMVSLVKEGNAMGDNLGIQFLFCYYYISRSDSDIILGY